MNMSKCLFLIPLMFIGAFFCFAASRAATCPAAYGVPYKVVGDKAIYQITPQCTKQVFDSELKFFSYHAGWNDLVTGTATSMAKVPWDKVKVIPWGQKYDPKYGALVKIVDNPKVYFVGGNQKRWIENEAVFNALHLPWSWIENVTAEALARFPETKIIASGQTHPNFTMFKYVNSSKVYRLEPDHFDYAKQVKRPIKDEADFKALGLRWDRILTIGNGEQYVDSQNHADQIYAGLLCPTTRAFKMLAFFDDSSYLATDAALTEFFTETSEHLFARTCARIDLLKIWHVPFANTNDPLAPVHALMKQNAALVKQADGFVYFTEKVACSDTYGGCTWPIDPNTIGIAGYCNRFADLKSESNFLYGSIIDWDHMYARCGYNDQEQQISDVSLGGECTNQQGTKCILKNGYSFCSNLQDKYYAQNPKMMPMSTVVHEIMHFFGTEGNMDHNETLCAGKYAGTLDDVACTTTDTGECFFNICRYTYENFRQAENSCVK